MKIKRSDLNTIVGFVAGSINHAGNVSMEMLNTLLERNKIDIIEDNVEDNVENLKCWNIKMNESHLRSIISVIKENDLYHNSLCPDICGECTSARNCLKYYRKIKAGLLDKGINIVTIEDAVAHHCSNKEDKKTIDEDKKIINEVLDDIDQAESYVSLGSVFKYMVGKSVKVLAFDDVVIFGKVVKALDGIVCIKWDDLNVNFPYVFLRTEDVKSIHLNAE